ncbi:MAG: hypothetical protein SWY16_20675 [Cyanobacteriota bacterium]|nr:hypothetical protein [Cyanobacteriota bacterium]
MIDRSSNTRPPAPCIIDTGIIVNKRDMQKVLADLDRVRYLHIEAGKPLSRGEGFVVEVFSDPQHSTIVTNHSLYLNVNSFDCLELKQGVQSQTYFDLVQEGRILRLVPLTSPLKDQEEPSMNSATLEAALAQVIAAKLDAQLDEGGDMVEDWGLGSGDW